MQNGLKIIITFLIFILLSSFNSNYAQTKKTNSQNRSGTLTETEIHNEVDKSISKTRTIFIEIDSTLNFNGIFFGADLASVIKKLKIQNIRTDSKMLNHKFGMIDNKAFCKIDTFSLIGFADFVDDRLVQISFESFNEYRHVASYFVKHFGMPDQYNDESLIWVGNNIKIAVTDNSKIKDKSSIIGNAAININLLNY